MASYPPTSTIGGPGTMPMPPAKPQPGGGLSLPQSPLMGGPPPGYTAGSNPGYHGPGMGVMGGAPTGPWADPQPGAMPMPPQDGGLNRTGQNNPLSPWSPVMPPGSPGYNTGAYAGQATQGASAGPADYAGVQNFADAAYDESRRYLDPQQEQQRNRHEQDLINMGIDPRSAMGQERMAQMQRGINDQNNSAAFQAMGFGQGVQDQMFNQNFLNTQQAGDMQKALWNNQTNRYGIDNQFALGMGDLELGRQRQDWSEYGDQQDWRFQDATFNEGNDRFRMNAMMNMIPGVGPIPTGGTGSINPGNVSNPYDPWVTLPTTSQIIGVSKMATPVSQYQGAQPGEMQNLADEMLIQNVTPRQNSVMSQSQSQGSFSPQGSAMALAMQGTGPTAPSLQQNMASLEAAMLMDKADNRQSVNTFTGPMAEDALRERALGVEQEAQAQAEKRALQAADQRYQDTRTIYGQRYPNMDPAALDALSRRAAAGEDVKNLLPMAFNQKERFEIADKIRDDAKPTIEGWNKTRTQFNQLESLAKRGWSDQGAGQVASLYSFIKALDPESVVREGEVALARSAESLINQFLAKYEGVTNNTLMSESMYNDILSFTQELNQINRSSFQQNFQQHAERADEVGIPRQYVFGESLVGEINQALPPSTPIAKAVNTVGTYATVAEAEAAAAAGEIKPGDKVTIGGKSATYQE